MDSNELRHYGVLGMKWGVRKDDRAGGTKKKKTSTDTLQKRKTISDESSKLLDSASRVKSTSRNIKSSTKGKKTLENMTDKELQEVVNRMGMEERYQSLTQQRRSVGQEYVDGVFQIGAATLTAVSSALAIAIAIKQLKGN